MQWGVILGDVHPGGPADRAGLQVGDVVTAMDGKKMENGRQLQVNLYGKPIGSKVAIEVLRQGQPLTKQVEVVERIDPDFRFFEMISDERNLVNRLGILGLDLDKDSLRMLPFTPRATGGVIVAALAVDVSLLGEQFEPGDIIYSVNGSPVASLKSPQGAGQGPDLRPGRGAAAGARRAAAVPDDRGPVGAIGQGRKRNGPVG